MPPAAPQHQHRHFWPIPAFVPFQFRPERGGCSLSLVTGRPWRTKGAFFTRTGQSTPARLGTAAGAPGAGRHRRHRADSRFPGVSSPSIPPARTVAAGAGGGCTLTGSRDRRHLLVPPSAPQDAQGCLEPGEGPAGAAAAPWVPPSPNPSPPGPPARRTIGRRSTERPKPMDQKLQLQHEEKNIPRAVRAAFCLLQIPEPDPFSLWV